MSLKILFIDDDPDDTEMYSDIVREVMPDTHCSVLNNCINLENDLPALGPQDFIFLDAHIPPMTAKECLSRIKTIVDPQKTRIIILTGTVTNTEENDYYGLGVAAVLLKGTSYQEIKSSLYHVLSGDAQQFA